MIVYFAFRFTSYNIHITHAMMMLYLSPGKSVLLASHIPTYLTQSWDGPSQIPH